MVTPSMEDMISPVAQRSPHSWQSWVLEVRLWWVYTPGVYFEYLSFMLKYPSIKSEGNEVFKLWIIGLII